MKLFYFFAALLLPVVALAQRTDNKKEVERIVITKKAANTDKLTIVIDGEKITVNGKPVQADGNDEITVSRNKIKDLDVWQNQLEIPHGDNLAQRLYFQQRTPNKAMLGVSTRKSDGGAEVMNVTEGSAAESAGLKPGDIIIEVERAKVETPDDLSKIIGEKKPGDKVTIGFLRDKKQRTAVAELQQWEAPLQNGFGTFSLPGFDVEQFGRIMPGKPGGEMDLRRFRAFSSAQTPKLGIKIQDTENSDGVKVIEVQPGSDAYKAGIKQGDIITEINNTNVNSTDQMRYHVQAARTARNIRLKLNRNGTPQTVEIIISRKIKTAEL